MSKRKKTGLTDGYSQINMSSMEADPVTKHHQRRLTPTLGPGAKRDTERYMKDQKRKLGQKNKPFLPAEEQERRAELKEAARALKRVPVDVFIHAWVGGGSVAGCIELLAKKGITAENDYTGLAKKSLILRAKRLRKGSKRWDPIPLPVWDDERYKPKNPRQIKFDWEELKRVAAEGDKTAALEALVEREL